MILVYKYVVSGGAETLFYRIGDYLIKRGEPCSVLCYNITDTMKSQFESVGIQVMVLKNWSIKSIIAGIKNERALFYSMTEFLLVEQYYAHKKEVSRSFLYVVHPDALKLSLNQPLIDTDKLKNGLYRNLEELIKNKKIIFMDEQCVDETEKYYKHSICSARDSIFYLPYQIEGEFACSKETHMLRILSIARAEFPFKGYFKGLLSCLDKSQIECEVCIVSYGRDINHLNEWINALKNNPKIKIELIGETSYKDLEKYYNWCDLYIGMGSTIIEAAARGKVCIPVRPYTYEFNASCYFHDNPRFIAAKLEENDCGMRLVEEYINSTNTEKQAMSLKSYNAYEQLYSMKNFVNKLDKIESQINNLSLPILLKLLLCKRLFR